MESNYHSSERGQAVILLVLALVVLLGFTALAVDGSMVYSDRRHAQSAADASSLAAASIVGQQLEGKGINSKNWTASPPNCSGQVANAAKAGRDAGVKRAKDNGYVITQNIKGNMGIVSECGMEPVFASRVGGSPVKIYEDRYMDLHTMITKETDTAFAHFIFQGPMVNVVSAVARVRPRQPLGFGYAIVSLNPASCKGNQYGVQYHGLSGKKGSLTVNGGGIWSNGCMDVDGNVAVTVNNGPVTYFSTGQKNDLGKIVMNPTASPMQLVDNDANRIPPEAYTVAPPDCSGHEVSSSYIISYYSKNAKPLPSGLYCVTDDMKINSKDRIEGYGVTFVMYGGLTINGDATIKLSAPPGNYVGDALAGIVLYANPSNTSEFKINGGSDSYFEGTILAPGASVDLSGNSMVEAFKSQVIAWNVAVGGASGTQVTYDDSKLATKPAVVDMYR